MTTTWGMESPKKILNSLTKINGLQVRSRTSSFAVRDQNLDAATIAERLNVSHILEGSIRKSGDTVRISAQLVDVEADTQIWSEVFEKTSKDVFEVQGKVAAQVTAAMQVALDLEQQRELEDVGTTVPEAYDAYLRGRQLLARRTALSIKQAAKLFDRAIGLDTNYAQAYLGPGRCLPAVAAACGKVFS